MSNKKAFGNNLLNKMKANKKNVFSTFGLNDKWSFDLNGIKFDSRFYRLVTCKRGRSCPHKPSTTESPYDFRISSNRKKIYGVLLNIQRYISY